MSDTLLGAEFKVMNKADVVHKLPTDSYKSRRGCAEDLLLGRLLTWPGLRGGFLLQAPSSLA